MAMRDSGKKGDRHLLPERPSGCFAQKVPVTFFRRGIGARELGHFEIVACGHDPCQEFRDAALAPPRSVAATESRCPHPETEEPKNLRRASTEGERKAGGRQGCGVSRYGRSTAKRRCWQGPLFLGLRYSRPGSRGRKRRGSKQARFFVRSLTSPGICDRKRPKQLILEGSIATCKAARAQATPTAGGTARRAERPAQLMGRHNRSIQ